ncbi:thioesterase superfamily protein [Ectocarpus siliculosus]|uniref:Acyl-coenzyme A thioesterase THEM4 n=1 Tax=Ectocarpus siliculosus TaxID=2880 RepID=D8LMS8_ECTSI|nr:thioesterase superfamily protein [Ectocarpus siliculosus]|eukprot:CBN74729.1 thioesterase superfamily protein [Ectocarpus siliculosus]
MRTRSAEAGRRSNGRQTTSAKVSPRTETTIPPAALPRASVDRAPRIAPRGIMRVAYRRRHAGPDGQIPDFLRSEFKSGSWERTGFDIDFPAIAKEPAVAAAIGYTGRNFIGDAMDIRRWYNRDANVMAGSVVFSLGCEGPPDHVHGGAVSTALDDVLGTMAWREVGFPRWGLPTMRLTVRFLAGAPMERQLRFDTRVVKREGRKVFVEAALRDPTCGNKLLAEGEGLFYLRKRPASPQTQQPPLTTRPPPTSDAAAKSSHGRLTPSSAERGAERSQLPMPPPPPTPSPPTPSPSFGTGNPNAVANLIAFYRGAGGGDPTTTATATATATANALRQRQRRSRL